MEGTPMSGPKWPKGLGWSFVAVSAIAASGCSNYVGTTAASFLRRVRDDPDPNLRYVAYTKLAQPRCYDSAEQKAEAVRTLLAKLDAGKEPMATRAVILNTLGALGDPSARTPSSSSPVTPSRSSGSRRAGPWARSASPRTPRSWPG